MNNSSIKILLVKIFRLAYDIITSVFDSFLYHIHWLVKNKCKACNDLKSIVFIGEGIPPRIPRLAKWIKHSKQYSVLLVTHKMHYVEAFSNDEWDGIYFYRNKYHLKRIVSQLKNVSLFHGFAPKSYYPDLVRQIVKVPFIIDYQDVYLSYYGENPEFKWLQKELPHEKNCLQLSDGLVAHSLEPNVVLRRLGHKKPPSIFFPLYCDNDNFLNNKKKLNVDDLHFVYAGGVAGSFRNKTHFGSIQFHYLINILSEQKIHFHIYPSPANFQADFDEYKEISKTNPYFHFHPPVNQQELNVELNKYHFGIIPFFIKDAGLSLEKIKYATALKLFNYIEAGIPVIVSRDVAYQSWIAERYHAGIAIGSDDVVNIKEIISRIDYRSLVETLMKNRERISLKANVGRMLEFYEKIK